MAATVGSTTTGMAFPQPPSAVGVQIEAGSAAGSLPLPPSLLAAVPSLAAGRGKRRLVAATRGAAAAAAATAATAAATVMAPSRRRVRARDVAPMTVEASLERGASVREGGRAGVGWDVPCMRGRLGQGQEETRSAQGGGEIDRLGASGRVKRSSHRVQGHELPTWWWSSSLV